MKQTITLEQLNELSDSGKERYRQWWLAQVPFWVEKAKVVKIDEEDVPEIQRRYEPLLPTIGQMIEFLDEHWKAPAFPNNARLIISNSQRGSKPEWLVFKASNAKDVEYEWRELADALWEAAKEVLEK